MKPMAVPPMPGAPVALELELGPEALPDETLLEQAAPSSATTALSAHTTLRALMSLSPLGWWSSLAGFVRPVAQGATGPVRSPACGSVPRGRRGAACGRGPRAPG